MPLLAAPSKEVVQTLVARAYDWVRKSRRPAPHSSGKNQPNLEAISMYRSPPITFKVPPGYTIPGATNNCQYVRFLGNQLDSLGIPMVRIEAYWRRANESYMEIRVTNWADGQPEIKFALLRTYSSSTGRTEVKIYYYGKPADDTRKYPIQMYWGQSLIMSDHRSFTSGKWIYYNEWAAASGQRGNKFFFRTEDIVAAKLLWGENDNAKLLNWCNANWGNDIEADVHAPLFNMANNKRTDFIYQTGSPVYRDCSVTHNGCQNYWQSDQYRGQSTSGWGFSHRSKVCFWEGGYTWILAQDPLGLQCQAIQTLNKTANPNHVFYDAWPTGALGTKPTMTPVGVANWVKNNYYRENVGATMWNVPVIGGDQRISSLRTNQFLVLTTLLGYKYRVAGWAAYADELANILTQVSVGGPDQPAYGCKTAELGNICRPDYFGSQLFVWDKLDGTGAMSNNQVSAAGSGVTGLGLKDFGWLRQTLNYWFNLPVDDDDFTLSTMETTATYAQALKVYLYHKYRVVFGASSTIPGY